MTSTSPGSTVRPTLGADDLVKTVPGLDAVASLKVETLARIPGASLTPEDVHRVVTWARSEVAGGSRGVVVAQGTDTLEETAFLADLYWDLPEPLVFTGGMRPATSVSADGPANLLDACRVASAADAAGAGVLVVLNGTVHRAVAARKRHSWMLNAFSSGDAGPWGHVVENELRRRGEASAVRPKVGEPQRRVNVPLLHTFLGDEGETLDVVMGSAPDGVVIGAFGVGHVSAGMANRINAATRQCPVVVASRTGAGGTHAGTYDFVGSETDLGRRGARLSSLDPFKARLLLWALLAAGAEVSEWPPL